MNPLKRLYNLLPQRRTFYGTIISINGDRLSIEPLSGGIFTLYSSTYAAQFSANDTVWLIQEASGAWTLATAPTFAGTETIEI